jgi:hypothetical protein
VKAASLGIMIRKGSRVPNLGLIPVLVAIAGCAGNLDRPVKVATSRCSQERLARAWQTQLPRFVSFVEREPSGSRQDSMLSSLSWVATARAASASPDVRPLLEQVAASASRKDFESLHATASSLSERSVPPPVCTPQQQVAPLETDGAPSRTNGQIAAEFIQAVVRASFGPMRLCYEAGLARDSNLGGRTATKFVIARDGSVSSVSDAGSDLPDPEVVRCVRESFSTLRFPEPEGGVVTVVYPIVFNPR